MGQKKTEIGSSFKSRNMEFMKGVYTIYVHPSIEYCIEIWNLSYKENKKNIKNVQDHMFNMNY